MAWAARITWAATERYADSENVRNSPEAGEG
jgi:hypothetical protein